MLAKSLAWASIALSLSARADVSCPPIFDRSVSDGTYYVLTFVGGSSDTGDALKLRQSRRSQIETNVTPKLQDYVYRLAKPISASAPTIILLTCDFPMGAADLDRTDLETLANRNVLATLWGGKENDKASVVYVSLPHYQRRPLGKRYEVEVAWLRVAATSDQLDDWSKELGRNSVAQQALLALAVGFSAIKQSDWQLAKLSLCQVRSNLKLLTQEAVRPAPEALRSDMEKLIKQGMDLVDEGARQKGLDLNAVGPIKLACSA